MKGSTFRFVFAGVLLLCAGVNLGCTFMVPDSWYYNVPIAVFVAVNGIANFVKGLTLYLLEYHANRNKSK